MKQIYTEQQHQQVLKEIDTLMGAELGTEEGKRLDELVTIAEAYEFEHFPISITEVTKSKAEE